MKIYVSGGITGVQDARHRFSQACETLRQSGFEPLNPFDSGLPDSASWEDHMAADIRMLLECKALAVILPRYGDPVSKGVAVETAVAEALGLPVKSVEGWSRTT